MKTVIEMAREAGLCDEEGRDDNSVIIENHLKRFANLVCAAEREACAKVCDERAKLWPDEGGDAGTCAIYIRERGNT